MKRIKVAAAALNQTPLAWDTNKAHILGAIHEARERGVHILCLPEMCITGYGCEDAFHAPNTCNTAMEVLREIVPETEGMIVSLGLPVFHGNAVYNAACLAVDGRIAGFVGKRHLAGEGLHYEPRWFKPWPEGARVNLKVDGETHRMGDLFFDCGGVRIGFEICEDAWVAARPGSVWARRAVDVILNPSASHFAFGKHEVRKRLVQESARSFGLTYIYANLLGNEAGRAIYDGDTLVASGTRLMAAGPRFRFADWLVQETVVDLDLTRMNQARTGSYQPLVDGAGDDCVSVDFAWDEPESQEPVQHFPAWEEGAHLKEEEFMRAVTLALFDYMRKSHSRGFVVSLSGGADSSAVACLIALMVRRGVDDIGLDAFIKKAGCLTSDNPGTNDPVPALVEKLLVCAYQSTRNSGEVTLNAARKVAETLGATFHHLDVDQLVTSYVDLIEGAIGRDLKWDGDDITLQNIQARVRAPGVWMLANIRGALLVATSNRSEAAVGYATMDGDTCGGLSPIAGIDKAFLRKWLVWLEETGPDGFGPIPALKVVNDQQPTAELRPSEAKQTDEDDLMPYELLDVIERAAIRDRLAPREVYEAIRPRFPQYNKEQLVLWIERFFRLWSRNQWKRERYAPSFHVDDENLDPKTWCRWPILSGGFERELQALKQHVGMG